MVEGCAQGGIGVDVVVVRHLFAAEQASLGDAGGSLGRGVAIERGRLVRVFAVAQGVGKFGLKLEGACETGVLALVVLGLTGVFAPLALDLTRKPLGNRSVIARGVGEGVGGKFAALSQARASVGNRRDDFAVLRWVNHDGNVGVILGGCSHHRRPTDVDLLHHRVTLGA